MGAASISTEAKALLRLIRPKQWIKNAFVVAPLVFAREYSNLHAIKLAAFAFVMFCVASSACYIVNDIHDVENDRNHPTKRLSRPLAAGLLSVRTAVLLLALFYAVLAAGFVFQPALIAPIMAYLLLQVAYSFFLKHQPVFDIFSIAVGFVLRVWAGAEALDVPLSSWMAITTLCLALYLASIKRRQELNSTGTEARSVLRHYSVALVDRYAEMSAMGALVFYSLFVISTNNKLSATIPLVIFGLFRYWFVVESKDGGESPTDAVFSDWPLALCVLAWVVVCVVVLKG
ncbi:MAG TPA: decaprenyl-phosphate phosphoribosyltransferase [Reyranella sp.]|nr:decaprenyl-phosphate phosphoribosyltransferase [Reyranella sp.]